MISPADAQTLFLKGQSVVFSQMEAGAYQRGFSAGFKWAPAGQMEEPGFRILAKSYAGIASTSGLTRYKRENSSDAYLLVGIEGHTDQGHVGLYIGADTWRRIDYLWGKPLRDVEEVGLRIQIEAITRPVDRWTLTTKAAISSASREIWGKLVLTHPLPEGPRLSGWFGLGLDLGHLRAGIETEHSYRAGYGKRRLGVVVTDIGLGKVTLTLSGGGQGEDGRRPSLYGRVTMIWRR